MAKEKKEVSDASVPKILKWEQDIHISKAWFLLYEMNHVAVIITPPCDRVHV